MLFSFKNLFSGLKKNIQESLPDIEERLLSGDVGPVVTKELCDLIKQSDLKTPEEIQSFVERQVEQWVTPQTSFNLPTHRPFVFFFIGVNGSGKTTTIAKMVHWLGQQGLKSLLVAGDTFRAAAVEQLKIWAERLNADFVGGAPGSDPASVVFNGIQAGKSRQVDAVLVDTSGRLQTKTPLMEELKKVHRAGVKSAGKDLDQIFLVLDATTGQNGLSQVIHFKEALPLTGLILTKYDGASRGGFVMRAVRETGLPLRFVGVGEQVADLQIFDPAKFSKNLF